MKIGFFSDRYLPQTDGVATSIETFRIALENMGHEVYIIAPSSGLRIKETSPRVIRLRAIPGLLGQFDYMTSLFFPPQTIRRLDKLGLDVVHYHTPGQIGLLGAYYALHNNLPLVTTYHTDLYEYVKHYPGVLPGIMALSMMAPIITGGGMKDYRAGLSSIKPERSVDRWNQKIVERGITLMHGYCDVVIAPSEKMRRQLESWHTHSKLVTLPTGSDVIKTTKTQIEAARTRYHIADSDRVILFVGRLGTEKGLELLVNAFQSVARSNPHAKLVIVGDGPARDALRSSAGVLAGSRIIFTGRIEYAQLGAIYGLASVFAFPSLTDTQGLVLNEAALAGVPLVMIDPHVSEIMREAQTGLYAKPTVRDLAAKLNHLIKDPELSRRYGLAAKKLASQFGATRQAEKLLRLYEEASLHHAKTTTKKRSS